MLPFLEDIRGLLDEYPDVVALGEISSDDSTATVAEYTQPGRLHMAYSFELLSNDSSPAHIRATVENLKQRAPQSWPCWTISNHDVERVVSRWGRSTLLAAHGDPALGTGLRRLRGSVCVFQGEELGLARSGRALRGAARSVWHRVLAHVQGPRRLPHAHALGCAASAAGFSNVAPWLPVPHQHLQLSVAAQERDHVLGPARLPPPARVAQVSCRC